jgi:hypothetical protein
MFQVKINISLFYPTGTSISAQILHRADFEVAYYIFNRCVLYLYQPRRADDPGNSDDP